MRLFPAASASVAAENASGAIGYQAVGPSSETGLVQRLKAGDPGAFEQMVRASTGRMLAVARRLLQCDEDAEDAVQEAFLSAAKSIGRFDGNALLSTWLHRITVNACLMKLRTQRRRPERMMSELLPEFLEDGHARNAALQWKSGPAPASAMEQRELREFIRARIDELPEAYREVLVLRDIEQLSTEETAAILDSSLPAIKTRLHRARQALRTLLEPQFAGEAI